jgi:hypothetical protein
MTMKDADTKVEKDYTPPPLLDDIIELERRRVNGFLKEFKLRHAAMMKRYKISDAKAAELQEFVGMGDEDYEDFKPNEKKYCQRIYQLWVKLEQKHKIDEVDEYTFTFWPTIGKNLWWMEFDSDGKLTDIGNDTYVKERIDRAIARGQQTQGAKRK